MEYFKMVALRAYDRVARFWETETIANKPGLAAVDLLMLFMTEK
jgi:hypothetical protein